MANTYTSQYTAAEIEQIITGAAPQVRFSSLTVEGNKYNTYVAGEAFNTSGLTLVANYSNGATKRITTGFTFTPATFSAGDTYVTFSYTDLGITKTAQQAVTVVGQSGYDTTLENNSWAAVHAAAQRSIGANYWAVGDRHSVVLNGTMYSDSSTTITLDKTYYAFILGFNHNSSVEGTGISFGCFKSYENDGWRDICISSSAMNFNNTNAGGWLKSTMRYNTLGSTDTAEGDASATTATSPVANTLMSCFPSELRNVMQPITKYTHNAQLQDAAESAVWSTIDYLPLPAEWEVRGAIAKADTYEQNYQERYAYYAAGNTLVKWGHVSLSPTDWCLRSPNTSYDYYGKYWTNINSSGNVGIAGPLVLRGVSPVFMV